MQDGCRQISAKNLNLFVLFAFYVLTCKLEQVDKTVAKQLLIALSRQRWRIGRSSRDKNTALSGGRTPLLNFLRQEVRTRVHNISISHKYEMLSRKVIEEHPDLHWIRRAGVSICYLESDQAKKNSAGLTLAECMLVREPYQVFCPYDFLIIVYTPNIIRMNEEQEKILLYHELLHVDMTEKEGKPVYRTVPHDVQDFRRIIDRYGLDWAGDCGG